MLAPAHGVLVTSATLADSALEDPFALAEMRTGAARFPDRPKTLRLASPFDYAANARAIVVTDVGRDDAAPGGRGDARAVPGRRRRGARPLHRHPPPARGARADRRAAGRRGLALYAQHVDPLEVGALVDIFRAEEDACLLGTDAVRDGVDVPGRSLRLLVFDRIPWPRPDLLHKARRGRFGGKGYDDAIARGPHRPGLRPADPPRRRPRRLRHARRRRADAAVLQPAGGGDAASGWAWWRRSRRPPRTSAPFDKRAPRLLEGASSERKPVVREIALIVNGESRRVVADEAATLLDVLNNHLHLAGPKFGCGAEQCGSCAVLVDGVRERPACGLEVGGDRR